MTGASLIRAMIVDDELPARSELRFLLEQHPEVCVVCEAGNFQEAMTSIRLCQPHLIFLDIEMPGVNGIHLAEKILEEYAPLIVFATAHEEFAVKAFELDAVDYLLKPFAAQRVAQCVAKVRTFLAARRPVQLAAGQPRDPVSPYYRQKIAVEQCGKTCVLDAEDIIAAASSEGSVCIYTGEKVYHSNIPLQELQTRLDETLFFRCHRGFLVNTAYIREIIPWFNGTYNLVLRGLPSLEIPVSRQQAPKLKKIFSL
ncbi:MAG: LytTR family DNA-binding domain-containing protein [Negativicutes bacterium]|nr:LytTR family DNA-binding domain-containing protein [Negativicutes bacterium]